MSVKKEKDVSFSSRASKYDSGFEGKASQKFYNLLLREVKLQHGEAVLDVGCGTGALLKRLSDVCDINCYGIDAETNMIREAQAKNLNVKFDVSPCDKTPFPDNTFDVVIACMAYHHFDNKNGFIKETARILKPNGLVNIADPRFPWLVRKMINGVLKLFRINGVFYTSKEIENQFLAAGFMGEGFAADGYAQVITLKKTMHEINRS